MIPDRNKNIGNQKSAIPLKLPCPQPNLGHIQTLTPSTTGLHKVMGTFQTRRKLETILECDECSTDEFSGAESSLDKKQPSAHSVQPGAPKRRRLLPPPTSVLARQITFQDFRIATIEKYPSFSFLGPSSMAVYWCKLFLKKEPFGWIHQSSPPAHNFKKRSQFWHIPGQYLTNRRNGTTEDLNSRWRCVQDVLSRGEAGVHYATSYVGVYNLLRTYGRFGLGRQHDGGGSHDDCHCQLGRDVVLVSYHGPDLPPPRPFGTSQVS
jgi:hypothetical protein